ncbi:MAG: discoidin domain-containing protein, partial [Prolixibacteraceae bacterium]
APGFFDKERHVAEKDLNTGMENGQVWMPAEVDVSIRPGWFYHEEEDSLVKSPEELFDIYLTSVGRGSNLLLNIPPDRRGLLHENDVKALEGWKKLLDEAFDENLAENASVKASAVRGNSEEYAPENMLDDDKTTYWSTDDEVTGASFEIDLEKKQEMNYLVIQEYIRLGQRVKSFRVEVWKDGNWQRIASPTTIGYKRIVQLNGEESDRLKVTITDSKACPVISAVEVY